MTCVNGITRALEKAGNKCAMARDLGVTRQAVQNWMKQGYVSRRQVVAVETLYGIPRAELLDPRWATNFEASTFDAVNDGE